MVEMDTVAGLDIQLESLFRVTTGSFIPNTKVDSALTGGSILAQTS